MPSSYSYDLGTFAGRLNTAMESAGFLKVLPFARRVGLTDSTIRNYLSGRAASAGGPILAVMAAGLCVNDRWLATGEGPMRPGEDDVAETSKAVPRLARVLSDLQLSSTHELALETVAELLQDMTEVQAIAFRRAAREAARKILKHGP